MNFLLETLRLGLANLALHQLRSLLTALGIIFGVAAVITMVAIGEGNKNRALAEIQNLGSRNIIVRSVKPPVRSAPTGDSNRQNLLSYGIKRTDVQRIRESVRPIRRIVQLKEVSTNATQGPYKAQVEVYGTTPELIEVTSLRVGRGRYITSSDGNEPVAVIGDAVAERLFPLSDPLEGSIRIEGQLFRIVGVLAKVGLAGGAGSALVGRDLNFDIHIPLAAGEQRFGDTNFNRQAGSFEAKRVEVTELYIEVADQSQVRTVADQVQLIMDSTHTKDGDVTVIVPLELLEQAERTLAMFNLLMIAIAGISLLVGGIGIMNIMLASVTERIREIGIRRAVGATRRHIAAQFLVETTVLSGLGGILGVLLGFLTTGVVEQLRRWHVIEALGRPSIPLWSVVVSFTVATLVGIVFGLYPALMASRQDPIVALRHD